MFVCFAGQGHSCCDLASLENGMFMFVLFLGQNTVSFGISQSMLLTKQTKPFNGLKGKTNDNYFHCFVLLLL